MFNFTTNPPVKSNTLSNTMNEPNPLEGSIVNSVVIEHEKWSPYQNFVVFCSTVLLWQRPIIFFFSAVFTHFFLWYTSVAITKWNPWLVVGSIISFIFISDFILSLLNFSMERFLSLFPKDGTERVSYEEIIKQYVSLRRFVKTQFRRALQFRQEQPQQFLISSLFFTLLICFALSMVNLFMFVYISVFSALVIPGLWHNDILQRIYLLLLPYVVSGYQVANDKITEIVAPKKAPTNPSSQRVIHQNPNAGVNSNHNHTNAKVRAQPTAIVQPTGPQSVNDNFQQPMSSHPVSNNNSQGYMQRPAIIPRYAEQPQYTIPPPNYFSNPQQQPRKRQQ